MVLCDREHREYSHEEVVAALLEMVDEGTLEMGVDAESGASIFWFAEDGSEREVPSEGCGGIVTTRTILNRS